MKRVFLTLMIVIVPGTSTVLMAGVACIQSPNTEDKYTDRN